MRCIKYVGAGAAIAVLGALGVMALMMALIALTDFTVSLLQLEDYRHAGGVIIFAYFAVVVGGVYGWMACHIDRATKL